MAGGGAGLGAGNPEYLQRVMGGASSGVNRLPESRAERSAKAAPQARQQAQQTQQAPLAATTLAPEAQGAPALAATTLAPEAQTTGPVIPEGFRRARGDYQFGPGTVGRYNGQYVFKDPVTDQYLATRNQADAYLRAFGTDGTPLTFQPGGMYSPGPVVAGMPRSQYRNANEFYRSINAVSPGDLLLGRTGPNISRERATEIYNAGSRAQNAQQAFTTLYDKLLEGTFKADQIPTVLNYLVDFSKQANTGFESLNSATRGNRPQQQFVGGVPVNGRNEHFSPQQHFLLPKETWNMKPQELMNWIQRHEKNAGKDSFMGNAAWVVGPALIGGAGATGITGITGPSVINSAIGSGIENLTGMTSKASGGIVNLLRSKS